MPNFYSNSLNVLILLYLISNANFPYCDGYDHIYSFLLCLFLHCISSLSRMPVLVIIHIFRMTCLLCLINTVFIYHLSLCQTLCQSLSQTSWDGTGKGTYTIEKTWEKGLCQLGCRQQLRMLTRMRRPPLSKRAPRPLRGQSKESRRRAVASEKGFWRTQ